jgi:aspartyl-tRNA(Asn)/glutamyl-tRNA(Gln) amidotransferase subunit A
MGKSQTPTSIQALHAAFENAEWTPTSITRHFFDQARPNRLNAWLTLCEERALEQAAQADRHLADAGGRVPSDRYPLFGVPMGIKDNLAVAGVRLTCASRMLDNYIAPYTSTVVQRLESAGAITLGKLNLDEFAMGGSNENSAFGRVLHPTHSDRVAGGSSGGSAAAVAGGECLAALGSDTGGSIRLPASYCGLFGMKPTYGRVSRYGLVAFASSLDQVGPITRSVDDGERILGVISGPDVRDSTSLSLPRIGGAGAFKLNGLRIGLPTELHTEGDSPSVRMTMSGVRAALERAGAEIVPCSLPHVGNSIAVYYVLAVSEASSNLSRFDGVRFGTRAPGASKAGSLEEFYAANRSLFGAEVKRRILLGTFSLSSGYADEYFLRAAKVRALIARDFEAVFQKVDCILSPVAPTTAFRAGEKNSDPLQMYLNDLYTVPANLAGIPAITVPWSWDEEGLPVGIQLMGPAGGDAALIDIGRALEALQLGGVA